MNPGVQYPSGDSKLLRCHGVSKAECAPFVHTYSAFDPGPFAGEGGSQRGLRILEAYAYGRTLPRSPNLTGPIVAFNIGGGGRGLHSRVALCRQMHSNCRDGPSEGSS
jgi:hypothetical protein